MKFIILFLANLLFAEQIKPTLIKGRIADPKEFPASVYAQMGNSRCTATVVGERTLLIAAHCVRDGGTANFKADGIQYSSTCTHSPLYSQKAWEKVRTQIELGQVSEHADKVNATADWALCLVNKTVINIQYENLNTDPSLLSIGDELLLSGYGCTQPGGSGGNDGNYRIGEAKITDLPSGSDNDITTYGGVPGAALCYGDSGGPAFFIDKLSKKRVVVSVNSRGNIKDTSYLPSVSTSQFKSFLTSWSNKTGQKICGYHKEAKNCRDMVKEPIKFTMGDPLKIKLDVTIPPVSPLEESKVRKMYEYFLKRAGEKCL